MAGERKEGQYGEIFGAVGFCRGVSSLCGACCRERHGFGQGRLVHDGSPNDEPWRSGDETAHPVELSDFYIAAREVTQAEWEAVMNGNPSAFKGPDLPVENMTWLDAVTFCNAKSRADGLAPAYEIAGDAVTWNRASDGWRLPAAARGRASCMGMRADMDRGR